MRSRSGSFLFVVALLALLAACGSVETRTERVTITKITPIAATPAPQAAQPSTAQPSTASPSAASAQPAATPTASAAAGASTYAGIAQSKTADGYYMLGEPNAPVVLTHYSDFL